MMESMGSLSLKLVGKCPVKKKKKQRKKGWGILFRHVVILLVMLVVKEAHKLVLFYIAIC